MIRRQFLQLLSLSFVPISGLRPGVPSPGRITVSYQGAPVFEGPIDYHLNSVMKVAFGGLTELVRVDGCELYRPGDSEPFLQRSLDPPGLESRHDAGARMGGQDSRDGGTRSPRSWAYETRLSPESSRLVNPSKLKQAEVSLTQPHILEQRIHLLPRALHDAEGDGVHFIVICAVHVDELLPDEGLLL